MDYQAKRERQFDRDRRALAELLQARGHQDAAEIVAASTYATECGDFDMITVVLDVPAALFDIARAVHRDNINAACGDFVNGGELGEVVFRVQRPQDDDHWIQTVVRNVTKQWVRSERADTADLDRLSVSSPSESASGP